MSIIKELLAAIEADPTDEASQMVIADHLQAEGDARGDLIVLDHAERRGLLVEQPAIEQLLTLAAEYSFPRAEPEDPPIRFEQLEEDTFETWHGGIRYVLSPWNGEGYWALRIENGDDVAHESVELDRHFDPRCFEILGDAIRAGSPFEYLRFEFDGIQIPMYEAGPLRCYQLPLAYLVPRGHLRNRFGLAARDYHRWHAIWNRLRAMQPAEDEF